jgi:hypothetical protein
MQYALLIYEAADYRENVSDADWGTVMDGHTAFWKKYGDAKFASAAGLEGHHSATTVRKTGSSYQVTDGPFAETREILGGFYVVNCENLEEAISISKDIPLEDGECVEVRPVMSE